MKGTIKWFNQKKGYGFIQGEDKKDIFVHRKDVPAGTLLNEGDNVEYQINTTEKKPRAINIKKS